MAEYTIIRDNAKDAEETMGKYIKQGWEPIGISAPTPGYLVVLMKKNSPNPSENQNQ
jgi:hypothetical protein